MKKSILKSMLCLTAAMVLIFVSISAFAEEPDFSVMSDEQLLACFDRINGEIVSRGIEKTAVLAKGTYIAGRDIPVGSYVYTCLAVGDDWGNLTVYSDGGDGDQLLWDIVSAPENGEESEQIFIRLNEGDELKSGVSFSLTIAPGVVFR